MKRGVFEGANLRGTMLIPSTVEEIGDVCFKDNWNIRGTLNLPEGLRFLGSQAFYGCGGSVGANFSGDVLVPEAIKNIDNSFRAAGITSIDFGTSVTNISNQSFLDCKQLTNVVFHGQIVSIGNEAFKVKSAMCGIFPEMTNLICIGSSAFIDRTGITGPLVAPNIERVGAKAFWNSRITDFVAPFGLTNVASQAFYACTMLTNVVFSDKIETVANDIFAGGSNNKAGSANGGISVYWRAFPKNGLSDNVNANSRSQSITHYITKNNEDWISFASTNANFTLPEGGQQGTWTHGDITQYVRYWNDRYGLTPPTILIIR